MPTPAVATHAGNAHGLGAAHISTRSAMVASPAPTTRRGRARRSAAAASVDPPITARLNGSSIAAAARGRRPSVSCKYRVARVITEVVVRVFRNPASVPCRSCGSRSTARGSSGEAARVIADCAELVVVPT
jgi:hypothetical protein